jgi:hypothetical protein
MFVKVNYLFVGAKVQIKFGLTKFSPSFLFDLGKKDVSLHANPIIS